MQLSDILQVGYDAISYLSNLGLNPSRELIICYSLKSFNLSTVSLLGSNPTRVSGIVRHLKSKLLHPLELENVTMVDVYSLPQFEQLGQDNIKRQNNKVFIDIPQLLRTTNCEQVIIQFEKHISEQQMNALVPFRISCKILCILQKIYLKPLLKLLLILLIYGIANSPKIRDINRKYTLLFMSQNVNELLPNSIKHLLETFKNKRNLQPAKQY